LKYAWSTNSFIHSNNPLLLLTMRTCYCCPSTSTMSLTLPSYPVDSSEMWIKSPVAAPKSTIAPQIAHKLDFTLNHTYHLNFTLFFSLVLRKQERSTGLLVNASKRKGVDEQVPPHCVRVFVFNAIHGDNFVWNFLFPQNDHRLRRHFRQTRLCRDEILYYL
jgi:hypothetical protein